MFTVQFFHGFTPEIGDDAAGALFEAKSGSGQTEFETLAKAKSVAKQAAKYANAAVAVVNEDFEIVWVA